MPGSADRPALRVASYNVRSLRGDRAALVRVVLAMRPDVLCLQEAPRLTRWRSRRRDLARDVGMTVGAGGRVGGTAVFVAPGVRLLHRSGHRLRWFIGLEWRAVALAVVVKDGVRYAVCSVHLDLLAGARLAHATQVVSILERTAREFGAHPVLAGDVNERPGGAAWRFLAGRYTDCFVSSPRADGGATYPAHHPASRLDAVFAGPGLVVVSCAGAVAGLPDLRRASDHRPVVAEVRPRADSPGGAAC